MQRAFASTERTIVIISPDYLSSSYRLSEWSATFTQDPAGALRHFILIQVEETKIPGSLQQITSIDLVGLTEPAARGALIDVVRQRLKPTHVPMFPGPKPEDSPTPRFPRDIAVNG